MKIIIIIIIIILQISTSVPPTMEDALKYATTVLAVSAVLATLALLWTLMESLAYVSRLTSPDSNNDLIGACFCPPLPSADNPCDINNCEQLCSNVGGSFVCQCSSGFDLATDGRSCSGENKHHCSTVPRSHARVCIVYCAVSIIYLQCECNSTMLALLRVNCIYDSQCITICRQHTNNVKPMYHCSPDIDECASNNGGCQHNCANSRGTFSCSCNPGFELAANGLDCNGQ